LLLVFELLDFFGCKVILCVFSLEFFIFTFIVLP